MAEVSACPKCGQSLPVDAPAGICPRCLYRAGIEASVTDGDVLEETPTWIPEPVLSDDAMTLPPAVAGGDLPKSTAKGVGSKVRYFGDYELMVEIARGGMGVVYKARQVNLNRLVALKMILAGQLAGPDDIKRFYTEAEAAAQLDHPGIVPIFEVGQHEGQHFFSMGFVEGQSLAARVAEGPLPPREAAQLVYDVALAVQYAHNKGVIHRDLKPGNILLDQQGNPRVTDFGLAKLTKSGSELTGTGQILGTPSYMPPEQAAGKTDQIGPPADVYALGAILYCLLTGRPPFQAASPMDTLLQVLDQEPVSVRQLNAQVPLDLETITLKCLDKLIARRYDSAQYLADELRRFLHGRPILARPVGRFDRVWRWCKRQPMIAGLSVSLLVALLAGTIISGYFAINEREQKFEAKKQTGIARTALVSEQVQREIAVEKANDALLAQQHAEAEKDKAQQQLNVTRHSLFTAQLLKVANLAKEQPEQGRRLLDDTEICPLDLRDFSWRCYYRLCGEDSSGDKFEGIVLKNGDNSAPTPPFSNAIFSIAFTSDSHSLIVGTPTEITVWDVARLKQIATLDGHQGGAVAFAFAPDGKTLASAGADRVVRLWDVATWTQRDSFEVANAMNRIAFTRDLKLLADGDYQKIHLWDVATKQAQLVLDSHHGRFVASVAFAPEGRILASGDGGVGSGPGRGELGEVKLWNAVSGEELRTLKGHLLAVKSLAFAPDGRTIASAGSDGFDVSTSSIRGSIRLWDPATGRERTSIRLAGDPTSVAFSTDGRTLATGINAKKLIQQAGEVDKNPAGQVMLWDPVTGQERITLSGHPEPVQSIAFSGDGRLLASGSLDGTVKLWQGATPPWHALLKGPGSHANCVTFAPNGEVLASGSGRYLRRTGTCVAGEINIWDVATGQLRLTIRGHSAEVRAIAFTTDSRMLASGSADKTIKLWETNTGEEKTTLRGHGDEIRAVAIQPNGNILASASAAELKLWDISTGTEIAVLSDHQGAIAAIAFAPDGKTLASASEDHTVRLWDVEARKEKSKLMKHSGTVTSISFTSDGTKLAARCPDEIAIWDLTAGTVTARLNAPPELAGLDPDFSHFLLAFFPDGKTLAYGSFDGVKVWHFAQGREAGELWVPIRGSDGEWVKTAALSANGKLLASARQQSITGSDHQVTLWDVADPGALAETRSPVLESINRK